MIRYPTSNSETGQGLNISKSCDNQHQKRHSTTQKEHDTTTSPLSQLLQQGVIHNPISSLKLQHHIHITMAPIPNPETLLALPPTPENTVYLSNLAPSYLSSSLSKADTYSNWALHETLFYACIRAGEDNTAKLCIQRISDRFGSDDDRVSAMAGVLEEVMAETPQQLEQMLQVYELALEKDPTRLVRPTPPTLSKGHTSSTFSPSHLSSTHL